MDRYSIKRVSDYVKTHTKKVSAKSVIERESRVELLGGSVSFNEAFRLSTHNT